VVTAKLPIIEKVNIFRIFILLIKMIIISKIALKFRVKEVLKTRD
jgi:hypothetical protein